MLTDGPFNLKRGGYMVFCFIQNYFFVQHKSQNIYFFCRAKREFFFPEFNIRLYDKNSESDYFFSSTIIRIFFSATLGIKIFFFRKKTIIHSKQDSLKIPDLLIICLSSKLLQTNSSIRKKNYLHALSIFAKLLIQSPTQPFILNSWI